MISIKFKQALWCFGLSISVGGVASAMDHVQWDSIKFKNETDSEVSWGNAGNLSGWISSGESSSFSDTLGDDIKEAKSPEGEFWGTMPLQTRKCPRRDAKPNWRHVPPSDFDKHAMCYIVLRHQLRMIKWYLKIE